MARPQKYPDAKIIEALEKAHGMIYAAARTLGCDPGTIYNRAKLSKPVACCLAHENGLVNDMAELKLYEAIMAGDMRAIIFRLSTKARDRGYGDKVEVASKVEGHVELNEEAKAALTDAIARRLVAMGVRPKDVE